MRNLDPLMLDMYKIKAIKFGKFKLKSGMISPVYIDLRVLVSYPKVLKKIAQVYQVILRKIKFKRMVAVPYTALPIVANISVINNKPWIYTRKESKDYGIKRPVEGIFKKGEKIVMIDDMITTGASKIETVKPLKELGLNIKDIVVLVDREQGGKEQLERQGFNFYSVFTITQWLRCLLKNKKLSTTKYNEVLTYLENNKIS